MSHEEKIRFGSKPFCFAMLMVGFNAIEVKAPDGVDPSKIYGIIMLWNNSMSVYDVAVSVDGNYIAAVNQTACTILNGTFQLQNGGILEQHPFLLQYLATANTWL